jgi:hypothetical protein
MFFCLLPFPSTFSTCDELAGRLLPALPFTLSDVFRPQPRKPSSTTYAADIVASPKSATSIPHYAPITDLPAALPSIAELFSKLFGYYEEATSFQEIGRR